MSADMSGDAAAGSPALHVIVLGSGGGPREDNTTSLLLRSLSSSWHKSSLITLDGGTYLSSLITLLSLPEALPPPSHVGPLTITKGPFSGLTLPYASPEANAGYITSHLVDAHLITHPHLDHISGIVMATAGPPGTKPKKIAALPQTIQAFRSCVFNDVIWPNLSDENGGAGMVTYLRLMEGGSSALGQGAAKGYSEICDGLLVKGYTVAHGNCVSSAQNPGSSARGSSVSVSSGNSQRQGSHDGGMMMFNGSSMPASMQGSSLQSLRSSPRSQNFGSQQQLSQQPTRRSSLLRDAVSPSQTWPGSPSQQLQQQQGSDQQQQSMDLDASISHPVVESSAYFIQDQVSAREILVFGDVEPDSISLSPRNRQIWREAAPKILAGRLAGIFIECSYPDLHDNDRLYGHLKPVFVVEELCALAREVDAAAAMDESATDGDQAELEIRKRKRRGTGGSEGDGRKVRGTPRRSVAESMLSPKSGPSSMATSGAPPTEPPPTTQPDTPHIVTPLDGMSLGDAEKPRVTDAEDVDGGETGARRPGQKLPLEGLRVVINHVKERLDDQRDPGDVILEELQAHAEDEGLGCEFVIARKGMSLLF